MSRQVRAGEHAWRWVSQGIEVARTMASQLHTVAEAAGILKVRESWLKTKARLA